MNETASNNSWVAPEEGLRAPAWVSSFCDLKSTPFRVWDPDVDDFGVCFTQMAFTIPTHALLAAVSAYFAGALAGEDAV